MKKVFILAIGFILPIQISAQIQQWVARYTGNGNAAKAIALDSSGNVYVTGFSYGSGTGDDYATIKYNTSGDTMWIRRYNGLGNGDDAARAIALDVSGNVYVTGLSRGSGTGYDYATIKYNSSGDTVWVRRYNGRVMAVMRQMQWQWMGMGMCM